MEGEEHKEEQKGAKEEQMEGEEQKGAKQSQRGEGAKEGLIDISPMNFCLPVCIPRLILI